jgi:hypothetical protein
VGEPDFLEFDHAGFHCIIQRTPEIGILCGYVAIPEGHPWHREVGEHSDVDVHGGITYARDHAPHSGRRLDVLGAWWIGFDTGHAGDFAPGVAAILGRGPRPDEVYKDLAYVRAETERLAEQAKAAACP